MQNPPPVDKQQRCTLQTETLNPEPWVKLIGRANEDKIYINGKPVTGLWDTGDQVTHISYDFCKGNGIQIKPIGQIVNIEMDGGDSVDY